VDNSDKQRPYQVSSNQGNEAAKSGKKDHLDEEDAAEADDADDEEDIRLPLPETEVLWHMSQSKKHKHLLKHPVITTFLWLKWNRISSAYAKNLLFYFAFVVFITAYIFALYGGRSLRSDGIISENCSSRTVPSDVNVLWYINTVLLVILFVRELLQFGVAPRRYFFSIENWLEVRMPLAKRNLILNSSPCFL
jgi:hypothetical protein